MDLSERFCCKWLPAGTEETLHSLAHTVNMYRPWNQNNELKGGLKLCRTAGLNDYSLLFNIMESTDSRTLLKHMLTLNLWESANELRYSRVGLYCHENCCTHDNAVSVTAMCKFTVIIANVSDVSWCTSRSHPPRCVCSCEEIHNSFLVVTTQKASNVQVCVCACDWLLFTAADNNRVSWMPLTETNDGYSHVMIFEWKATKGLFVYRQHQLCFLKFECLFIALRGSTATPLFLRYKSFSMHMASNFLGWKRVSVLNLMLDLTSLTCADSWAFMAETMSITSHIQSRVIAVRSKTI